MATDASLFEALLARRDHASAAIDWCEANYAVTPHVAEFYNTLSSLSFCAAGASMLLAARALRARLPAALLLAGPLVTLLGLFSAAFHATLALPWQRADEVAENLSLVALLHGARAAPAPRLLALHAVAATLGILFVHAFLFTEAHLVATAGALARALGARAAAAARKDSAANWVRGLSDALATRLGVAGAAAVGGAAAWLVDRAACSRLAGLPFNPQLHAVWHLAGALALHEAFSAAALAAAGGRGVALRTFAGGALSRVEPAAARGGGGGGGGDAARR